MVEVKDKKDLVLGRLRQETAIMHENLERTVLSKALLNETVSFGDYIKYLLAMKAVMAFAETNIFPPLQNIIGDLDLRYKHKLIVNDLDWLAKTHGIGLLENVYQPEITSSNPAFLVGFLYVTEGSTLGGRYIIRHLSQRLGINENNGGSFFSGYGDNTGRLWNSFINELVAYAGEDNLDEIITGAGFAFSSIQHFFEMNGE